METAPFVPATFWNEFHNGRITEVSVGTDGHVSTGVGPVAQMDAAYPESPFHSDARAAMVLCTALLVFDLEWGATVFGR